MFTCTLQKAINLLTPKLFMYLLHMKFTMLKQCSAKRFKDSKDSKDIYQIGYPLLYNHGEIIRVKQVTDCAQVLAVAFT